MASKIQRLRTERAILVEKANELSNLKDQTREQSQELDRALDRINALDHELREELDAVSASVKAHMSGRKPTIDGMRTAEEFRAHYAKYHASHEPVGLADFIRGVAGMPTTTEVRNALSTGTDTAGGFMVPALVMPGILEALVPASSVLTAGATIIPVSEGAKSYTQAAIDNIPTAAWRNEAGPVAESDPTFRAVVGQARSLAFRFKVSRELLADAANIELALRVAIAQAFAKELDRVALMGSGTAPEPRGLLNWPGVGTVGNGANGAALAGYANLFSALQNNLNADAPQPTAAIMSPRSLVKLGSLTDTTGQPLERPEMLRQMQMLSTSQIPDDLGVGTSDDCSLIFAGDFSRMAFMMREYLSIQKLNELYAGTGEIGFVCHMRADVLVQYPQAFSVISGVRP